MARRQLNVSLSPEQYEWLSEAAQEVGETPTGYARTIIIEAVMPPPEIDLDEVDNLDDADASAVRAWVLATLVLLHLTKRRKPRSSPR
jgi:hypothetical protein